MKYEKYELRRDYWPTIVGAKKDSDTVLAIGMGIILGLLTLLA